MHIGLTEIAAGATVATGQAAAEYVGTALSGALRSIGDGLRSAGQTLEDEPLLALGAVIAVLALFRLLRRRR